MSSYNNNTDSDDNKVRIFYSLASFYLLPADISSPKTKESNGVSASKFVHA